MINLISGTQELRAWLNVTPGGSPPDEFQCYVGYRETTDSSYTFGNSLKYTNSSTPVTLVAGSSVGSAQRIIDHISIINHDASATATKITVAVYDGTNYYILVSQTVSYLKTLTYNDKQGWKIIF